MVEPISIEQYKASLEKCEKDTWYFIHAGGYPGDETDLLRLKDSLYDVLYEIRQRADEDGE